MGLMMKFEEEMSCLNAKDPPAVCCPQKGWFGQMEHRLCSVWPRPTTDDDDDGDDDDDDDEDNDDVPFLFHQYNATEAINYDKGDDQKALKKDDKDDEEEDIRN